MMQLAGGGAAARPFVTHHNALDIDALPADRARAVPRSAWWSAGSERVYEINRNFRNEGVSTRAQPRVHDARVCTRPTPTYDDLMDPDRGDGRRQAAERRDRLDAAWSSQG